MKAPDLNAPRYRYKFLNCLNNEFLSKFRQKYPEYDQYSDKVLRNFINKHCKAICASVINNRDGIELQNEMGKLFIGMKIVSKSRSISWKDSVKLGTKVYYKNHETDGRSMKIYYSTYGTKYNFANKNLWYFSAVRQFSRSAGGKNCTENWRRYHQIDNYQTVWDILAKRNFADKAKRSTDKVLKTYNEFDLE